MESNKDSKRKKDKYSDDDDYRREMKSKRARSRSRSPADVREKDSRRKRRHSRSKSRDRPVKQERQREDVPKEPEVRNAATERRAKNTDMLNTRTGGAYIPPARLRMMQAEITDKSSAAYQRLAWEALKKSIHGHINKINVGNIGIIIKELLKDNIVRGRGLLCRSVIQAQAASPTFTNVYAALVAAVNSRFPNIGELLLKRLVIQFKRGFKRNDKPICISSASFIAHLVNQRVAHEILALELLTLLVETPTDDSVEVAISFLKECGQKLTEVSSKGVNAIFEMLRNILHEGQLDKRVQYMIEVMFQVWKDGFKDHPALIEELELVPEEEQFTHLLMLDDATDPQDILNVFKLDEKFEENEQKYTTLSKEILGSDADSDEEGGSGDSGSEGSGDEDEEEEKKEGMTIIDNTETNLVALRRTIYLTINSSLDFEECAHKLMKMQLKPGQEVELCHMFLDCCAEQRTYEKFYGLLAQRFCNINRIYIGPFEEIFKDSYSTAHRLDTNRLRNVSKFFAHLLFTDSISWEVLECVKLNEEDTTSSSRIYIKILFQELAEYMGLKKLNDRLKDPTLQEAFLGVFPRDNPKNTRFSINFFTSIGLGGLTDELREHLKQMPKNVPALATEITLDSESSSDSSSSSSTSSSDTSSDSEDEGGTSKKGDKNKESKKNKDKEESPKTPQGEPKSNEDKERWGHDGFYDTYGKDAQRHEPRTDRRGDAGYRDQDNFVRPRDVRQDGATVNRRSREEQRGEDFRRNDESRRRDDDNRKDEDENRRRVREDDGRYTRDDRNADREGSRQNVNRQNDGETGRHRGNERRRDREDRNGDRGDERQRHRDDRCADREDSRKANINTQEDVRRRNREDNERRDTENRSGDTEDSRRSKRDDNESRQSRIDEDTRPSQESKNRDKVQRNKVDYYKNKSDKEDRGKKNKDTESGEEDETRSRRHEKENRNDRYEKQRERIADDSSSKRDDRKRDEKDNRKTKSVREEKKNRSDEVDSSEEESRSARHEKDNKHNRKERNRDAESRNKRDNRKKEDDSSSDDDSTSNKRKKERRRKEKVIDPDSWDIRRGSSVRREIVGRYWDN